MDILIQSLAFLITILVLVSVHEAGHFLVAKAFGIPVIKFSIGFGRTIFRFKDRSGTEYAISWLPLGGYVRMLDEREMKVSDAQKPHAFNRQSLLVRTAVVIAGPLTNFLFAVVMFWLMYSIGLETTKPVVGEVIPHSIAARAGVTPQDQILAIDQRETPNWQKVVIPIVEHIGQNDVMTMDVVNLQTHGTHRYFLKLQDWKLDPLHPDLLNSLGIQPYRPPLPAILASVDQQSPAAQAGLKKGDKILMIGNKPVGDWYDFVTYLRNHPDHDTTIRFERQKKIYNTQLKISHKQSGFQKYGYIGVTPPKITIPKAMKTLHQYNILYALGHAIKDTWEFLLFNFTIIKKMILGQISLGSLGGPIALFATAEVALIQGLAIFLGYLGLISVMLGFVNILPIPGLDGGYLLYYFIELIRGKPLSPAMEILTIRIGLIILLLIMFIGTFNDILRLFSAQ